MQLPKFIKNFFYYKNLFLFILILALLIFNAYTKYKGILQIIFLNKNNNPKNIITKYPEDLEFLNKIINKYFREDNFSSPTFYFSPFELGIHILADGYRANNFRVKNKYLIKNENSLISFKSTQINQNNLRIIHSEKLNIHASFFNIHGFFINIKDPTKKISYYKNYKTHIIDNNKLISCNDINLKNLFFESDHKSPKKKFLSSENCKYYQFLTKDNLLTSIKLFKDEEILFHNVKTVEVYGNKLDIDPYIIIDTDSNNFNYFYAVDYSYVN